MTNEQKELVTKNTNLVHHLIKRYINPPKSVYEDCFQEGLYGLCLAAERFDSSLDIKFSTYASKYILGYIKRFIRDNQILKESRANKDLLYQINKYKEENSYCTIEEICSNLNITTSQYWEVVNMRNIVYLNEELDKEDGNYTTIGDVTPSPEDSSLNAIQNSSINFFEVLKDYILDSYPKYKDMYNEYFYSIINGTEIRQKYLAEKYGVTQPQISRMIIKINKKIADKYKQITRGDK